MADADLRLKWVDHFHYGDHVVARIDYWYRQVRPAQAPTYNVGIYWEKNLGLISLTMDGSFWTTISDKNEWASIDYGSWATMSELNCGCFYQWWNNYWFAYDGWFQTYNSQVDTTWYDWQNPYSDSDFHFGSFSDWANPHNPELWGDTTDTDIARQWPCANGFHIPYINEFHNLIADMTYIWDIERQWTFEQFFMEKLMIPLAWVRFDWNSQTPTYQWSRATFWTSSTEAISPDTWGCYVQVESSWITEWYYWWQATGHSLRAFKNTPVVPWQDPTQNWIVLYQPS